MMTMVLRLAFVSIDIRLKEFSITIFSHVLILSWHFRAENRSCTTKACENDLAKSLPLESPFFHQRNSVFLAHNQLSDVLNIFFFRCQSISKFHWPMNDPSLIDIRHFVWENDSLFFAQLTHVTMIITNSSVVFPH